ncbi:MAG: SprT family zinc-dependent metalloprotease [Amaricoccus sp.]|uniref:M48 family metallopeptidase n=1 Tax=Amaricoccus sp. TaxID=1872485 RepID=UPI003315C469
MTNTDTVDLIEVAGLSVEVVRKAIKNLHVGVYPPEGHVRVAASPSISLDAIRLAVLTRIAWIRRKQEEFRRQARETPRRFVSGETHYVFGRPCRLEVRSEASRPTLVVAPGNRLLMVARRGSDAGDRERQMARWRRQTLREQAAPRIAKWVDRLAIDAPSWGVRRMKTKWGSCNAGAGWIWLNLELAKKPLVCLDYVILHEMAHFLSPKHDDAFVAILDREMPTWRQVRANLNMLPLAFETSFAGQRRMSP